MSLHSCIDADTEYLANLHYAHCRLLCLSCDDSVRHTKVVDSNGMDHEFRVAQKTDISRLDSIRFSLLSPAWADQTGHCSVFGSDNQSELPKLFCGTDPFQSAPAAVAPLRSRVPLPHRKKNCRSFSSGQCSRLPVPAATDPPF